jgi:hypothetical protein
MLFSDRFLGRFVCDLDPRWIARCNLSRFIARFPWPTPMEVRVFLHTTLSSSLASLVIPVPFLLFASSCCLFASLLVIVFHIFSSSLAHHLSFRTLPCSFISISSSFLSFHAHHHTTRDLSYPEASVKLARSVSMVPVPRRLASLWLHCEAARRHRARSLSLHASRIPDLPWFVSRRRLVFVS